MVGIVTVLSLLLAMAAPVVVIADVQADLTSAITLWTSHEFTSSSSSSTTGEQDVISYGFTYSRTCFCWPLSVLGPNNVMVTMEGTVDDVMSQFGEPIEEDVKNGVPTIDELFQKIQDAITSGVPDKSIKVTFDPTYGYPSSISIDYDVMVADDEYIFDITHFAPYSMWMEQHNTNEQIWKAFVESGTDDSTSTRRDRNLLRTARRNLIDSAVSSYSFTFARSCFCEQEYLGPFVVVVNVVDDGNGNLIEQITEVTNTFNGETDDGTNTKWNIPTIAELHIRIDNALTSDPPAHSVVVTYDKDHGYPTNIAIDYSQMIADEEFYAEISDVSFVMSSTEEEDDQDNDVNVSSADPPPSTTCPLDIELIDPMPQDLESSLMWTKHPIEIVSQDTAEVTFRVIQGWETGTGTVDSIYVQCHDTNSGNSVECVGMQNVSFEQEVVTLTATCYHRVPITVVEVFVTHPPFQIKDTSMLGEIPNCCKPTPDVKFPTVHFVFKLWCKTQCGEE